MKLSKKTDCLTWLQRRIYLYACWKFVLHFFFLSLSLFDLIVKVLRFGWRATYVTPSEHCRFAFFPIHIPHGHCIYLIFKFNSIVSYISWWLLLFCHFFPSCQEIYGKSERFICFRAMGLVFILLLFSLHITLLLLLNFFSFFWSMSLLFIIVFVVFENLLLFYYHFDKAADTFALLLPIEEGKCYIFLWLRVWKFHW